MPIAGQVAHRSGGAAELTAQSPLTAFDWMHALIALAVVAWLNTGLASHVVDQVPGYARWGMLCAWLGIAILHDGGFARSLVRESWPLVLLILYASLMALFGAGDLAAYQYGLAYLLAAYALFIYYARARYRRVLGVLVLYLVVDTFVVGVNTYLALNDNPGLARLLAVSEETRRALLGADPYFAIGGYGYVYALGALAVALGYVLLNHRSKRLLVALPLLGCLVLLVKASYTIAIVLTLVLLVALALRRFGRTLRPFVPAIAALVVAGVLAGPPLLRYLSALPVVPDAVSVRLDEIATGLGGGDLGGSDLHGRTALYGESVNAFLHNVAFGTSANPDGLLRPGGHSTGLDLLAAFGVVALLALVFLVKAYRLTVDRVGGPLKPLVSVVWLYFLVLGIVNTLLFANLLITWFLFLPAVAALLSWRLHGPAMPRARRDGTHGVRGAAEPPQGSPEADAQKSSKAGPTIMAIHHASGVGGGTKSFLDVLEMLRGDYRIVACCPESPSALPDLLRSAGFEYLPITLPLPIFNHYNGGSAFLSRTTLAAPLRILKSRAAWTAFIRSQDPDLVIVNSAVMAPLGPSIRAAGARSLCFVRETFAPRWRSPRTRLMYRLLDRFDGVAFLSRHDQTAAGLLRASGDVVRDCVDDEPSGPQRRGAACEALDVPEGTFNILYVGGASRIKGLDVALKALVHLPAEDVRLIVAGDMSRPALPRWPRRAFYLRSDAYARSLGKLLDRTDVEARTIVVGLQADMHPCYCVADVVVFPATSAHQARPVIEAGLYALPVITSRFAETADLVADGVNGLTFAPGDAVELADCLSRLHMDRDMARVLGEGNRARTLGEHSLELEKERLLRFVDRLLIS